MGQPQQYLVIEDHPFDVQRVSDLLRAADVLCTPVGISDDGFDPYHLPDYRVQEHVHGNKGRFLLDLNVLRRINSLHPDAPPLPAIGDPERVAAALMAFGMFANVLMDPGLAVREWFTPAEDDKLREQIRLFRELDDLDPAVFADIALGNTTGIRRDLIVPQPPLTIPSLPGRPDNWDFDYSALLKVAILTLTTEKAGRSPAAAMEEYLQWCWRDFLFSGPAIQFGGLFLSPRRKKNMFKRLRSGNAQEALEGVRNATWDLAYLRVWGLRTLAQRGTTTFHFFCTLDQALRESAREFLILGDGVSPEAQERLWKRIWGDRDGPRLLRIYTELAARQDDPQRPWNTGATKERAEELKAQLESELTMLVQQAKTTGSEAGP